MDGYCPQWQDVLSDWELVSPIPATIIPDYDGFMNANVLNNTRIIFNGTVVGINGSQLMTFPVKKDDVITYDAGTFEVNKIYFCYYKKRDYSGR